MNTINEVTHSIMFGEFTNEQLNAITQAMQYRRTQLSKQVKQSMAPGVSVSFVSNRSGQRVLGTVERVAIKNIVVRTALGLYRVPANMIEVV